MEKDDKGGAFAPGHGRNLFRRDSFDPGWNLWKWTKVGCRMLCDLMDNVDVGMTFWRNGHRNKKHARWLTRALNDRG